MKYHLARNTLILLLVLHTIPAKKSKRMKSAQCPGMPSSRKLTFDDVLSYAADISAAHRSLEAQECFSLAVALAADDKDRNIALYNLAVVQMDLRRSSSFTRISRSIFVIIPPQLPLSSYCFRHHAFPARIL